MNNPEDERIKKLEKEVEFLKGKLDESGVKSKLKTGKKATFWIGRKYLGSDLSGSINDLTKEVAEGKVTSKTIGNVITYFVQRFTRIGVFLIIASLIPFAIITIQTILLHNQNKKIDIQNKRIIQQTYLQEAERRSSLIFLMNNVLDKIDEELSQEKNPKRRLTPQLIGRIISLSKALKPYQYLEKDSIIANPISPERGQLLINLIESKLDSITYIEIFAKADFSYSDLEFVEFPYANLNLINLSFANLSNSNLEGVNFTGANLSNTSFENSDLSYTKLVTGIVENDIEKKYPLNIFFKEIKLDFANFKYANLTNCNFSGSRIHHCNFDNADLRNSSLDLVDILNSSFNNSNLEEVNFIYSKFENSDFNGTLSSKKDWDGNSKKLKNWIEYINEFYSTADTTIQNREIIKIKKRKKRYTTKCKTASEAMRLTCVCTNRWAPFK